jgi:CxxC-x17-CxxC domain-containing protein
VSFTDVTLSCKECGEEFIWTEGEQRFYASKGLVNQPARCWNCRSTRRAAMTTDGTSTDPPSRQRVAYPVQCEQCGRATTVPFVPRGDRPVYCSSCFTQARTATPVSVSLAV